MHPPVFDVELHGQRLAYRQLGSGPVLVLVHGLAGTMATWDKVVVGLSAHYTVVVPDLPGHGGSGAPNGDYSLGAYASSLRDLLDALGHQAATVIGHSFGGGIAMQFAYQFPERCQALVLVSSGGLGAEVNLALRAAALPGSELVLSLAAHPQLIAAGSVVGRWAAAVGIRPNGELAESARSYASLSSPGARRSFVHTLRSVVDHHGQRVTARDRLSVIDRMPTLIVWGTNDRIIPVEHAHNAHLELPNSRLELFDGAGHFPHVTHPDRFVQVVDAFLQTSASIEETGAT